MQATGKRHYMSSRSAQPAYGRKLRPSGALQTQQAENIACGICPALLRTQQASGLSGGRELNAWNSANVMGTEFTQCQGCRSREWRFQYADIVYIYFTSHTHEEEKTEGERKNNIGGNAIEGMRIRQARMACQQRCQA